MSQIHVNVAVLNEKIYKLELLKKQTLSNSAQTLKKVKDIRGSGMIINIISEIDNEHTGLMSDFEVLLDNSINFLKNVSQSYSGADEEAASNINGGV